MVVSDSGFQSASSAYSLPTTSPITIHLYESDTTNVPHEGYYIHLCTPDDLHGFRWCLSPALKGVICTKFGLPCWVPEDRAECFATRLLPALLEDTRCVSYGNEYVWYELLVAGVGLPPTYLTYIYIYRTNPPHSIGQYQQHHRATQDPRLQHYHVAPSRPRSNALVVDMLVLTPNPLCLV